MEQNNKPKIKEIIIVEGRYDKNTLSQMVDAEIVICNGFGIFKDSKKRDYLRNLAEKRGVIILTDSDSAGFLIRNNIKSFIDPALIRNAYIPRIPGKESRKAKAGKEGILGVEGMSRETILSALQKCNATFLSEEEKIQADPNSGRKISNIDLYQLGLIGRDNSAEKRSGLIAELNLPDYISTRDLIRYLNINFEREAFLNRYR